MDPDRLKQAALLQFVSAIGFMLVTLPLAMIYDVHQASADRGLYGGPLRVGAMEYAWPVYVVVVLGGLWLCVGLFQWSEAHDSEKVATTPQPDKGSLD